MSSWISSLLGAEDVTSIPRGAEGAGLRRNLTTVPLSNWELPEGFLAPWFPAVRGTSSSWPAGLALLTLQSDTPGVCLSLEKWLSVLELWRRWTQGCFHECFVFVNILMDNLLWDVGCSGDASW